MKADWVEQMLVKWGEAMFAASTGGSGAASSYPAYQIVHIRGTAGAGALPVDYDVMRMEMVMASVKLSHPKLYHLAVDLYVQGLSKLTASGRQHCHIDTVYARLEALKSIVSKRIAEQIEKSRAREQVLS